MKRRKDGRLCAKVAIGNGKSKFVYAQTKKELDRKVTELKIKLGKGIDVQAAEDTFGEWAELWLKQKKTEVALKRWQSYTAAIAKFETLNNIPLNKIRAIDIQSIINDQVAEGRAEATLKTYKMAVSQVYKLAIDNRAVDYNPAAAVKINAETEPKQKRALTEEEQQWICDTPHRAQTAAMIMMYAGLRRGELIPLLWTDIDLDNKTISVNKAVTIDNNKTTVKKKGKSKAAIRIVHIPDKLVDYLQTVDHGKSLLVCPNTQNRIHSGTSWRNMWDSYIFELNYKYGNFENQIIIVDGIPQPYELPKKYAPEKIPVVIPRFTPHWLRHTFITLMYFAGVDVMTAKEQAGHSDVRTTMQIYTHLDNQYKEKQISKLNDFLNEKNEKGSQEVVS